MDHFSLSAISSDPRSGIRVVKKRVTVVLDSTTESNSETNLIKLLNQNLNKYSPDIGGILLGYKDVRCETADFEWSRGDSDEIVTLKVCAKFFLFSPCVGSTLRCTVKGRSKSRVDCLALNHFPVTVYNPDATWDSVCEGDVVQVEVQVISQMTNTTPVIIGVIRYNGSIIQHGVSLDDSDSEEDVVNKQLTKEAASHEEMSTVSSLENSQTSTKKRKHDEEMSSSQHESQSPIRKKSKIDTQTENSSTSHTSSTSGSSEEVALKSTQEGDKPSHPKSPTKKVQNSTIDQDPLSQNLTSQDPVADKSVDSSSKKMKILQTILPRPKSNTSSSDTPPVEASREDPNKSKNKSISKETSMDINEKSSESDQSKVPANKKKRNSIPEGFEDISPKNSKNKRLQAPNGEIFKTYKACWDFVEKNPDYLKWKSGEENNEVKDKAGLGEKTKLNEEAKTSSTKKETGDESDSDSDSTFEEEPVKIPPKEKTVEARVQKNSNEPITKTSNEDRSDATNVPTVKKSISSMESQVKQYQPSESSSDGSSSSSEDEQDKSVSNERKAPPEPATKPSSEISQTKVDDSSSSSDSSSDDEEDDKPVAKKTPPVRKSPSKPGVVSPKKPEQTKKYKNAVFQSSSESESEDEEVKNKKESKKPIEKPDAKVLENGKEDESSYEEESDSDTGFEDEKKKKLPDKKKVDSSSSSSSDSESESDEEDSIELKKKTETAKKVDEKKDGTDVKSQPKKQNDKPSTPTTKKQPPKEAKSSPALITNYLSKTPKKQEENAQKPRENLIDKVLAKSAKKSPQLSSTVASNFNSRGKKKVELPEGISPILKKSKSLSSKADKSIGGYYDQIIKTSKVGSDETLSQPVSSSAKAADDKSDKPKQAKQKDKKKNKKTVAGFL